MLTRRLAKVLTWWNDRVIFFLLQPFPWHRWPESLWIETLIGVSIKVPLRDNETAEMYFFAAIEFRCMQFFGLSIGVKWGLKSPPKSLVMGPFSSWLFSSPRESRFYLARHAEIEGDCIVFPNLFRAHLMHDACAESISILKQRRCAKFRFC